MTRRSPVRCCTYACDYMPEKVRAYMAIIRQLRRAGEDPAEAARSVLSSKGGGGTAGFHGGDSSSRYAVVLMDVERAMLAAGPGASAETVAALLCPFSKESADVNLSITVDARQEVS